LLAICTTAVAGHPLDGDGESLRVGHRDVARSVRSCHFDAEKSGFDDCNAFLRFLYKTDYFLINYKQIKN